MLLTSSDTCLQNPPRENLFQYVRRVYATAINLPCISTLVWSRMTDLSSLIYKNVFQCWQFSLQAFLTLKNVDIYFKSQRKFIFLFKFFKTVPDTESSGFLQICILMVVLSSHCTLEYNLLFSGIMDPIFEINTHISLPSIIS